MKRITITLAVAVAGGFAHTAPAFADDPPLRAAEARGPLGNERLSDETQKKLLQRARRVVEGSREWDLLFAEEMERAYAALLSRGE